jgi:3',5'-cyclic-AMP phosphodiesterase
MIIAQISDTHITLDTADSDQRIRDFERAIADINALDPAPDVIFHTGDIVHNGRPDEYAEAIRILDKAKAPVYVIPGNKDDRANLRAAFAPRGYLSPGSDFVEYAVEDFPVRLIAVDTLNTASNKGDFCAERAKRLVALIDAEPSKPIAAFAHHPPFAVPVGPDPLNFETPAMLERLREALQHSDRVKAVFCGHVHRQTGGQVGRIPVHVATCVATPLRKGEYSPAARGRPIYYVHRFDAAGGFVTETRIAGAPAMAEQGTAWLTRP